MSIVPPHDPMDPTAPRLTDLEPEAEAPPFLSPEQPTSVPSRPVTSRGEARGCWRGSGCDATGSRWSRSSSSD